MENNHLMPGWRGPSDGMEVALQVFHSMAYTIAMGGRVVIGTLDAHEIGSPAIVVEDGVAIVLRRATRDEYLRYATVPGFEETHAPFYYELAVAVVTE